MHLFYGVQDSSSHFPFLEYMFGLCSVRYSSVNAPVLQRSQCPEWNRRTKGSLEVPLARDPQGCGMMAVSCPYSVNAESLQKPDMK